MAACRNKEGFIALSFNGSAGACRRCLCAESSVFHRACPAAVGASCACELEVHQPEPPGVLEHPTRELMAAGSTKFHASPMDHAASRRCRQKPIHGHRRDADRCVRPVRKFPRPQGMSPSVVEYTLTIVSQLMGRNEDLCHQGMRHGTKKSAMVGQKLCSLQVSMRAARHAA